MQNDDIAEFGDVGDVLERYRGVTSDSPQFLEFLSELRSIAENGSAEAAIELGSQFFRAVPPRNLEEAYRWFFIGYSLLGYLVTWNELAIAPYYSGEPGDFRNEVQVNELLEVVDWQRCRTIDVEAKKWLVESGLIE